MRETLGPKGGKRWFAKRRRVTAAPAAPLALGYTELRRSHQALVAAMLRRDLREKPASGLPVVWPLDVKVSLGFVYHEKDRHRDPDGVSAAARKIILDALVDVGFLRTDGAAHVGGFGIEVFRYKGDPMWKGIGVQVGVVSWEQIPRTWFAWVPARLPDFNELLAANEIGIRRQLRKGRKS